MNIFQSGDKYELAYSSCPRAGMVAGYVEIISVDRIAESDMQFNPTSIKGCFDALAGEITYIVYSDSTNTKKKKTTFIRSRRSKEYADRYCNGILESEWFSPAKRNYYPISTDRRKID